MWKTVRNLKFSQALPEILFQVDEQTPPKVPVGYAASSQGGSVLIMEVLWDPLYRLPFHLPLAQPGVSCA